MNLVGNLKKYYIMINFKDIYSLNSDYVLKHDEKRTFLISSDRCENDSEFDWEAFIHPGQAKVLSFFTHNLPLNKAIEKLVDYTKLTKEQACKLIIPFINNKDGFYTGYENKKLYFPKNVIIKGGNTSYEYDESEFDYESVDLVTQRFIHSPSSVTLMLTNKCVTDCIYCYADTKKKLTKKLDLSKVYALIEEAYKLKVVDFSVIGGEIFRYENWDKVLEKMACFNYYPEIISTKKPISEDDILKIKCLGINNIQISLDTSNVKHLSSMLKVSSSYLSQIKDSLIKAGKHKLGVQVAITLTEINSSVEELEKTLDFLAQFHSVYRIDIGAAFYSLNSKVNFKEWGISLSDFQEIKHYISQICDKYHFEINLDDSALNKKFYACKTGSEDFEGAVCSANRNHMFILPDGKVTVCEQLYWNPNFIIGDVTVNTIPEIWNSEKALRLASLKREYFSKSSACSTCEVFEKCHKNVNKCWADILKAYGTKKWDYPDPRCFYAPKMENSLKLK